MHREQRRPRVGLQQHRHNSGGEADGDQGGAEPGRRRSGARERRPVGRKGNQRRAPWSRCGERPSRSGAGRGRRRGREESAAVELEERSRGGATGS